MYNAKKTGHLISLNKYNYVIPISNALNIRICIRRDRY